VPFVSELFDTRDQHHHKWSAQNLKAIELEKDNPVIFCCAQGPSGIEFHHCDRIISHLLLLYWLSFPSVRPPPEARRAAAQVDLLSHILIHPFFPALKNTAQRELNCFFSPLCDVLG
jgi:hypothetical protein